MKTKTPETHEKAWQMMKLLETDFGDKMVVSLLKLELLSDAKTIDTTEFYNGNTVRLAYSATTDNISSLAHDPYYRAQRQKLQDVRIPVAFVPARTRARCANFSQCHASYTQTEGSKVRVLLDQHTHSLTTHSCVTASKALEDLIDIRLFREENQQWLEKAIITRIWISTTNSISENTLEQLQSLFDVVSQNSRTALSAPATHAAQTVSLAC